MFPTDIPKSVALYEVSVMSLPPTWDGSFDLVNQRLLIAALTEEQWQRTISELFRVLKPGGSIQITEVGNIRAPNEETELPATKLCDVYSIAFYEKRNLLGIDCRSRLLILLGEAGFVGVCAEDQKVPLGRQRGKLGIMGSQDFVRVYRAMGIACLEEGGIRVCGSRAEVESVVEKAEREWDETPGIYVPVYAIT